jgi:hypothetical protein
VGVAPCGHRQIAATFPVKGDGAIQRNVETGVAGANVGRRFDGIDAGNAPP